MNAIIALCHFCEVHGPSILFCTQAFHSGEPQEVLDEDSNNSLENSSLYYYVRDRESNLKSPTPGQAPNEFSTPSTPTSTLKQSEMCEACRSMPQGQPGYISNDHVAKVSYVSSQHPHHPQVFTMVRQACVRSLSCEVCPGREGPIFFGDAHRGHVFSYTFFIKDSQARGFQRWYSIIVVMMDKIYLLNSWPFLVTHIHKTITELQDKSLLVYGQEQAKCPQRAHRLTMSMNPNNFLQHRGGSKPARSLIDLTADRHVFRHLHLAFTWVLKAGSNRLTERLLEGPPTEDSIIDLEKQEETEEGFIKLFSKKSVQDESVGAAEGGAENSSSKQDMEVEEDEEIDPNTPVFTNLRHLLKVIGSQRFHMLALHSIIGNQVVIRGSQKALVKSVIECLKELLPRGCCRIIHYNKQYEDSWRCNFLGLTPGTEIPPHERMYVSMDIIEPESNSTEGAGGDGAALPVPHSGRFTGFTFIVQTPVHMSDKSPTVLNKIESTLMNNDLADSVVEQALICIKEEWMNKVKVLFKFTKAGGNRSEEDTRKLLQVVGALEEDKPILKFWMTGLSVQYRNHMLSSTIHQTVDS